MVLEEQDWEGVSGPGPGTRLCGNKILSHLHCIANGSVVGRGFIEGKGWEQTVSQVSQVSLQTGEGRASSLKAASSCGLALPASGYRHGPGDTAAASWPVVCFPNHSP